MQEILSFLEKQRRHHNPNELKKCLEILQIKIPPQKVILVTGTNGKGSVCATLQTLLIAAGKNVGFFSSPHLIKINERIKFNGIDISDEDFLKIFKIVHEKLSNFHLSFFEYLTLMAAYYFYFEKQIDFAIFEIGLGGTLDATNALDHDISVITKLGLEHEDILGKGIKAIAKNKFGIIRKNNTVFHAQFPQEIEKMFREIVQEKNIKHFESQKLNYFVRGKKYPEYFVEINQQNYKLNLMGERAVENTGLALEIFKHLIPNYEEYLSALQNVIWPCRMERIRYKNRDVFLSGDHNPQGVESLMEILKNFKFENAYFVVGTCFDKDSDNMVKILNSIKNSHICLTETPEKTLEINDYSEFVKSSAEFSSKNPIESLNYATAKSSEKDLIVITGSLYLAGLMKKLIEQQPAE